MTASKQPSGAKKSISNNKDIFDKNFDIHNYQNTILKISHLFQKNVLVKLDQIKNDIHEFELLQKQLIDIEKTVYKNCSKEIQRSLAISMKKRLDHIENSIEDLEVIFRAK